MWKRINIAGVDSKVRIEKVSELHPSRLGCQDELRRVGIEGPTRTIGSDLQPLDIGPEENGGVIPPSLIVLVGDNECIGALGRYVDDSHLSDAGQPSNAGAGLKVF